MQPLTSPPPKKNPVFIVLYFSPGSATYHVSLHCYEISVDVEAPFKRKLMYCPITISKRDRTIKLVQNHEISKRFVLQNYCSSSIQCSLFDLTARQCRGGYAVWWRVLSTEGPTISRKGAHCQCRGGSVT